MAQLTRTQLSTQASTVNVIDNNTKEIEAVEIRAQYTDERDSTINQLDDGLIANVRTGGKALTYATPPATTDLLDDDLVTKGNIPDLADLNYQSINTASHTVTNQDEGKVLYVLTANSNIVVNTGLSINLFRVAINTQQTIIIEGTATLQDSAGNVIANYSSTATNNVVFVSKVSPDVYRIIELNRPDVYETVSFNVSSDAPVSDDVLFFGLIEIDTASQVLHPKLTSVSYEVSLDAITYVAQADLTALQGWITTNGTANDYVIRTIATYTSGQFGSASSTFKFKTV